MLINFMLVYPLFMISSSLGSVREAVARPSIIVFCEGGGVEVPPSVLYAASASTLAIDTSSISSMLYSWNNWRKETRH